MTRKFPIPFVGLIAYIISLGLLVVGYILAISTFQVFEYDIDRFVIVLPILAIWIIVVQVVMSFLGKEKSLLVVLEIAYCVLVLFTLSKTLIPFLTNIATYYTVTMGDMETFAIGVPRCITACVLMVVSCIFFIIGSFFKMVKGNENNQTSPFERNTLITYAIVGIITIAASTSTLIWAAQDQSNYASTELKASLTINDEARKEYIEGQKFDTTGITFSYNDKEAKMDDVQIEYDFSVSGTRVVKFSLTEGKKTYVAKMPVTVYHVTHMDIKNHNIYKKGDGWDSSTLSVSAVLNGQPTSFTVPDTNYPNVVELKEGEYTLDIYETDVEGKFNADVSAGKNSYSIPCYDENRFSSKRVLVFYNTNQSGESLTLYVDSNSSDYVFPEETSDVQVSGTYVYIDSDNNRFCYPFNYHFRPGWNNEFNSQIHTEINGTGGLTASINGKDFTAGQNDWHNAVLGNPDDLEKYTVSYDANGGTGIMASASDVRGNFSLPQTDFIGPDGKAFVSWSINGDERNDSDTVSIYADTEIKALWGNVPTVDNKRILTLTNASSSSDKLTLFVENTDAPDGFIYPDYIENIITVNGQYLFERADGVNILYPFLYTLSTSWESSFKSNSLNNRIKEQMVGDDYSCTINGLTFTADATSWHNAVLGEEGVYDTFTITFDANGGTGEMAAVNDIRGAYLLPKCTYVAPADKIFVGWQIGDKEYGCGDLIVVRGNLIIKAIWGEIPSVDAKRTIEFVNDTGTEDTLTLYIESSTCKYPFVSTFYDGNIELITGKYLFVDKDGNSSIYPFTASITDDVGEFGKDTDYVFDRLDDDGHLIASIDGVDFFADRNLWRNAVIGEEVTASYLDEQIAASNPRIAKMTIYETGLDFGLYIIALTTDNPDGFVFPDMTRQVNVTGKYVFIQESTKEVLGIYDLKYRLGGPGGENWSSHFESNQINIGFGDEQISGAMHSAVNYDSTDPTVWVNFTLEDAIWQRVILGRVE